MSEEIYLTDFVPINKLVKLACSNNGFAIIQFKAGGGKFILLINSPKNLPALLVSFDVSDNGLVFYLKFEGKYLIKLTDIVWGFSDVITDKTLVIDSNMNLRTADGIDIGPDGGSTLIPSSKKCKIAISLT